MNSLPMEVLTVIGFVCDPSPADGKCGTSGVVHAAYAEKIKQGFSN